MIDERLTLAVRHKDALEKLLACEGWEVLTNILNSQIEVRRNAYELTPLENIFEAGKQEFAKGEIASLRLVLKLPESILDDAASVIDELTPDKEKTDGEENT